MGFQKLKFYRQFVAMVQPRLNCRVNNGILIFSNHLKLKLINVFQHRKVYQKSNPIQRKREDKKRKWKEP